MLCCHHGRSLRLPSCVCGMHHALHLCATLCNIMFHARLYIPLHQACAAAGRLYGTSACVQTTGILENTDFVEQAAEYDGMLYARSLVPVGGKCVCVEDGLPTWIGEMMVAKSPVEEAIEFIRQVEQELTDKIRITPKVTMASSV
jgi:hypothetical protein